ncbi:MAG: HAD-IB family hydrolase [Saprospiraceae bacterium]
MGTKNLILFDFDGTLSDRDSLVDLFIFTHGFIRFCWNMFISIPVIIVWKLGLYDAKKGKNFVVNSFYRGWTKSRINEQAELFLNNRMPKILRKDAIELVESYQNKNNTIVIVSANIDIHLNAFCEKYQLHLICTNLLYENGIYTGKFASSNCDKQEKVNRIKAIYNKNDFDKVIAFGNSSGDKAMLNWANEGYYRYLEQANYDSQLGLKM